MVSEPMTFSGLDDHYRESKKYSPDFPDYDTSQLRVVGKLFPLIIYRKGDKFHSLITEEALEKWPSDKPMLILEDNDGNRFVPEHLDSEGWWIAPDMKYCPVADSDNRINRFFVYFGVGLSNGYPWRTCLWWSWKNARGKLPPPVL